MALQEIKVLDFTHLLPGEITSTLLADLQAQVLRIERLDPTLNELLPPLVTTAEHTDSLYFWSLHRNKDRIKIDLKTAEGVEVVKKLAQSADIILENFRPGVMARLGLGWEDLHKINSRLIYCSISGYGSQSQWGKKPGHDLNFVAEAGIINQTRDSTGQPVQPGVFISDYMSGTYAALAIVTALYERQTSGQGKRLEISMFESALSTLAVVGTMSLYANHVSTLNYPDDLPNHRLYRCMDNRYLAVAPIEPQFWIKFLTLIDELNLLQKDVIKDRVELTESIGRKIATKKLAEWNKIFINAECCVSPVNTVEEAVDYLPEGRSKLVTVVDHERLGATPQLANPIKRIFGAQSDRVCSDTVLETTKQLRQIGLTDLQINAMQDAGIIGR